MDWLTFTVSIIVAAFSGGVVSLVIPWSQWGVEKRKLKDEARRKLVSSWYELANSCQNNKTSILNHPAYLSLRRHLNSEAITIFELESNELHFTVGAEGVSANRHLRTLLAEIKRIEDKWGLV